MRLSPGGGADRDVAMEVQVPRPTKHILIVDDHDDTCHVMARIAQLVGASATCADGGAAALAHLATSTPDLIVVEMTMPDMDGLELLHRVRADPRTAGAPVVVYSAMSEAVGKERAMQAGATDYWQKMAADFDTLRDRLAAYLS
jgi:CheY-like chemotaxis protein